jgi:anti-sigma factor RsiW
MMRTPTRMRPHDPERNAAEYVSGELPRRARRWFESHLLDCEDCWREVLLGRLGRRLGADVREAAPAGLRDRVRASIEVEAMQTADGQRGRRHRFGRRRDRGGRR